MHAPRTLLLLLYIAHYITANATTAARRAQQQAVAACQTLTSPVTNDGTTTTITNFPDPTCWDTLHMTGWMTYWNTSTTICTATQSVQSPCQCRIDEPWATCFLRLTYAGNRTAGYVCTDLAKPENCTEPTPGNVVAGPPEIFYGAYSIWSLFCYLTIWHKTLTSATSLPAITDQLSKTKTSALSANHLLAALVQNYALEPSLGQALVNITMNEPILSTNVAPARPTQSNAQTLLGQLLQQVLEVVMSDWASGDFQVMAQDGMLLNGTADTTNMLTTSLSEQS